MAETKKLKIGILTFHYAHNYGAVLQCYALQQTLMKFCPGADISVVNYKNQKIKDGYKLFPLNTKNPYRFLHSVFGAVVYFYDRVKRTLSFYNFVKEKLNIGSSCLNGYDVIFYGSDQIWNPLISTDVKKSSSEKYKAMSHTELLDSASVFIKNSCLDKTYLGQGFNGTKIAYGASDGNKLELTEDVKKMLDSFSSVSVREKTLAKKLALLNKGVSVVCDPVFLLSKEEWLKISVVPKEKNYIFAYKVADNPDFDKEVEFLGRRLNKKVIQAVYVKPLKKIFCKKQNFVVAVNPLEFTGYIANADFVVTTSFHGTAFSCLFEKKFCALKIKDGSERITDLLDILGLQNRYVEKISDITDFEEEIHNDTVKNKMEDYRNNSKQWISGCMQKNYGGGYKCIAFSLSWLQFSYLEAAA